MSEPDVASSDPAHSLTAVLRDGDTLVFNGRKWFIAGVAHPQCKLLVVMRRSAHFCLAGEHDRQMALDRTLERHTFGKYLSEFSNVQNWIAESRVEIDQARLMVFYVAWALGQGTLPTEQVLAKIAAIKLIAAGLQSCVVERVMQAFGAMGLSPDTPLAQFWTCSRAMHLMDGSDEVHLRTVARHEVAQARARQAPVPTTSQPPNK